MSVANIEDKNYWFVGAMFDEGDQTDRFITEGIWENGYDDKYIELVKTIKPKDMIAIKSTYTRKNNLPFNNRGNTASVMGIKAIGSVIKNIGDGRKIEVDWTKIDPVKEWYFYTNRTTIWRVLPDEWTKVDLIEFTFNDKEQDIDRFRNEPYWKERFGDLDDTERKFKWTKFYSELADKLLRFKNDRASLINFLVELNDHINFLSYLKEKDSEGNKVFLNDIDPFTVIGAFNRGITDDNRKLIAGKIAKFLEMNESVPDSFEGIPTLNNMASWFFYNSSERKKDDIDRLWKVFENALYFADNEDAAKDDFIQSYNAAAGNIGIGYNLTIGLFWIRPWNYITLDSRSRDYINKKLNLTIGTNGPNKRCNANDYLGLIDSLETRFQESSFPVHSFPELSYTAWRYNPEEESNSWKGLLLSYIEEFCDQKKSDTFMHREFFDMYSNVFQEHFPNNNNIEQAIYRYYQVLREENKLEFLERGTYRLLDFKEDKERVITYENYNITNILDDGCFNDKVILTEMLERLRTKKNIILQGPPGTGKTWLTKKLAYAFIGERNDNNIKAVQFHPNLSYEDFVRGFRPSADGKLELADGPLMKIAKSALNKPTEKFVMIIEEINRGNPAQIFGEMLTLLEADKRTPSEALELSYRKSENETVYLPENLYVIGTMNLADRSLAMVDFALRRRFAFIDLEPCFNNVWKEWLVNECKMETELITRIQDKLKSVNDSIEQDMNLGKQFMIGHSYLTPPKNTKIEDANSWFKRVIKTEIVPLLEEYWYDKPEEVKKAQSELLNGV